MEVNIVDTTLRDGEQKAGIALGIKDKIKIAKLLDSIGIYQIEAGIPAMGGDERKSIEKIVELKLKAKISTWNRINIKDIEQSIACSPDFIHITVPSSDIQIKSKLNKDRTWVIEQMRRCISFAREKDFPVTVGMEDASRADFEFLLRLCSTALSEGAQRVRYADTVGILHPKRIIKEIKHIRQQVKVELEIHAHNDFGMAVANSLAAVIGGAKYVDCTFGGIGERAGNCNYFQFTIGSRELFGINGKPDLQVLEEVENEIMKIMGYWPIIKS